MTTTDRGRHIYSLSCVLGLLLPLASLSMSNGALSLESVRCDINEFEAPVQALRFSAEAQRMASQDEVRRATAGAQMRSRATVSPDYAGLPRIIAVFTVNGVPRTTIAAIVDGNFPQPGETIELAMRHRDPRFPCSFIPVTVVAAVPTS